MSLLFNTLPDGAFHLQNFISEAGQVELVRLCRELCVTHPLVTPTTKKGYPLALKVTSFGKCGWSGNGGEYKYLPRHQNGNPFPTIPSSISQTINRALIQCCFPADNFELDTVLMNWYPPNTGKLGKHQDVTEEDKTSPIVTISLGDTCIFSAGSEDYADKGFDIELKSGDVFVMGGESRLAYHEVKALIPGSSKLFDKGGRISLTGRKVFADKSGFTKRNEFQSQVPSAEIKRIEDKMLVGKHGRLATDSAPSALTKDERITYADYLATKGRNLSEKAFREYKETEKRK